MLLTHVQRVNAGGRRSGTRPAGIEQLVRFAERFLQAVPDLVPGALILRLFLTSNDFLRIAIAGNHARNLFVVPAFNIHARTPLPR